MCALLKTFGVQAVRLLALVWLFIHFALTVLYVLPVNPIKMRLEPLLQATIGTFFPQNWSLFAPNPLATTESLLVRCLTAEEVDQEEIPADRWIDLSGPLFQGAQRMRISAYERMVRPIENTIRRYLSGGIDLAVLRSTCSKGHQEACDRLNQTMAERRKTASRTLIKLGSAFCREAYSSLPVEAVAVRYRNRPAIPWSERFTGTPKTTDYEVGVFPLDREVALPGLYGEGVGR